MRALRGILADRWCGSEAELVVLDGVQEGGPVLVGGGEGGAVGAVGVLFAVLDADPATG